MTTHFEILIDASGSMGYMKGTKDENKFLLPDGKSTRTELVKKILINNIIPNLIFLEKKVLKISTFKSNGGLEQSIIFWDKFNLINASNNINNKLNNPEAAGTPLYFAIENVLKSFKGCKNTLIVISDGDANDEVDFDLKLIDLIKQYKFDCNIYFVGIDQNVTAEEKSRRLADFTKGKYINIKAINYDKSLFDHFLFEIKTSIMTVAIANSVAKNTSESQNKPDLPVLKELDGKAEPKQIEEKPNEIKGDEIKEVEEVKTQEIKEGNIEKDEMVVSDRESPKLSKLEKEVANNSNSIGLISNQLETLVDKIQYLSKIITSTNENEEVYFDSDINEAENKITGRLCEEYLYGELLKKNWDEVVWMNEKGEKGNPYDFEIVHQGIRYYVECKGTRGNSNEFSITKNEWLFYLIYKPNYRLYFVSNIDSDEPEIQRFDDLITAFENQDLIPFSSIDRKVKADRFWVQVDNRKS